MEFGNKPKATIFDVEYFGTKDGPGIRTVLFFKGCELNCGWCHNPESQDQRAQVLYYAKACVGCGRCMQICPVKAIRKDERFGYVTDPGLCIQCGACMAVCSFNARKLVGEVMSLEKVQEIVRKDQDFFIASKGGVTISGGEPMLQHAFVSELVKWLHGEHIHTAIETAGMYPVDWIRSMISDLDLVFIDFKHIDDEIHRKMTGAGNESSLKVMEFLVREYPGKTIIRIPVIPTFNDDIETIRKMLVYIREMTTEVIVELLPFHNLGKSKYDALAMVNAFGERSSLTPQDLLVFKREGDLLGLNIRIGSV
jgi:pyruvate formate lyase activating enzyme